MCKKILTDKYCRIKVEEDLIEEFVYLYILQLEGGNNLYIVKTNNEEKIVFDINKDGLYTLCTIKISTDPTELYYYYKGKFYRRMKEVSIQELIETDEIEKNYDYYFSTCHLKKCLISAAEEIDLSDCGKSYNKDAIYRRDLIWSTINIIQYLMEFELYDEAVRLLNRITGCNGICKLQNCGCHD